MSEEEECQGDDDLKCSVGEWSDFTPCDAECDQTGQMFRNRCVNRNDFDGTYDKNFTMII